jgi:hypothetical protein
MREDLKIPVVRQMQVFEDFFGLLRQSRPKIFAGTYLNMSMVRHCIESSVLDLQRTTDFHEIVCPDRHKRAAYYMKWIVKLKPVQIKQNDSTAGRAMFLINEMYALHYGLNLLNADLKNISSGYVLNLMYTLHYRPIIAEVLSSKMYLLEQAANQKTP